MHWILQFIIHHRTASSLVVTIALSLGMLSSPESSRRVFARSLTYSVFYPFQFVISLTSNIRNIWSENKKLRREVIALSLESAKYREQSLQNDRLRNMIDFSDSSTFELLPARIVLREPSIIARTIAINLGSKDGIVKYMPVISTSGIVGKVIQVLPHMSVVQTLQDPTCRMGVMVLRSRGLGIFGTDNGWSYSFRSTAHTNVVKGDTVLTSGLGGVYPRGLVVGTVSDIKEDANPLFKRSTVKMLTEFDRLDELFVVRVEPRWSAFNMGTDTLQFEELISVGQ